MPAMTTAEIALLPVKPYPRLVRANNGDLYHIPAGKGGDDARFYKDSLETFSVLEASRAMTGEDLEGGISLNGYVLTVPDDLGDAETAFALVAGPGTLVTSSGNHYLTATEAVLVAWGSALGQTTILSSAAVRDACVKIARPHETATSKTLTTQDSGKSFLVTAASQVFSVGTGLSSASAGFEAWFETYQNPVTFRLTSDTLFYNGVDLTKATALVATGKLAYFPIGGFWNGWTIDLVENDPLPEVSVSANYENKVVTAEFSTSEGHTYDDLQQELESVLGITMQLDNAAAALTEVTSAAATGGVGPKNGEVVVPKGSMVRLVGVAGAQIYLDHAPSGNAIDTAASTLTLGREHNGRPIVTSGSGTRILNLPATIDPPFSCRILPAIASRITPSSVASKFTLNNRLLTGSVDIPAGTREYFLSCPTDPLKWFLTPEPVQQKAVEALGLLPVFDPSTGVSGGNALVVADAAARKNAGSYSAHTAVPGLTKVIQTDMPGILWLLGAADVTADASWYWVPYSTNVDGTIVITMELGDVSGSIPLAGVMARSGITPSVGDGAKTGGHLLQLKTKPEGYLHLVTVKQTTFDVSVRSSTGYASVLWWDGSVTTAGTGSAGSNIPFSKAVNASGDWADSCPKPVTFWPSDANGAFSGDLTLFNSAGDGIVHLDVTGLDALVTLVATSESGLKVFETAGLSALEQLNLTGAGITELSVAPLTSLTSLTLDGTGVASLDLSLLTGLTWLDTGSAPIPAFDLSLLTSLDSFNCQDNTLVTSLALAGNTALTAVYAGGCTALTSVTGATSHPTLESLDLTGCAALESLDVSDTTTLDVLNLSGCTALETLDCTGLGAGVARDLNIENTALSELDLTGTKLAYLYAGGCEALESINLSSQDGLISATAPGCTSLASVNVSYITSLPYMDFDDCAIEELVAVDFDGAYGSSAYSLKMSNNAMTTDAVHDTLSQMTTPISGSMWWELDGNPCDGGTSLSDGAVNTGAATEALALAVGVTLVL